MIFKEVVGELGLFSPYTVKGNKSVAFMPSKIARWHEDDCTKNKSPLVMIADVNSWVTLVHALLDH